jgi:FkbM family methyltransferase
VIAVEAHPDMAAMLRRTFDSRARVLELALSDQAGEATLWVPRRARADVTTRSSLEEGANPGFDLRRVDVAMARLDALDVGQPAVIKIDVEGHEFSVLNGAVETLRRHRPICIVEVEERHNAGGVARAFAFFAELGYESWYLHRGRLLPGSSFAVSRLQDLAQAKSVQGSRSLDYVNNFIFVHPERTNGLERIRAAFP